MNNTWCHESGHHSQAYYHIIHIVRFVYPFTRKALNYPIQISYDTGAISLGNTNVIRTYPSDKRLIDIITSVAKYYGWKKIHLITQDEAVFTDVSCPT